MLRNNSGNFNELYNEFKDRFETENKINIYLSASKQQIQSEKLKTLLAYFADTVIPRITLDQNIGVIEKVNLYSMLVEASKECENTSLHEELSKATKTIFCWDGKCKVC